MPTYRVLLRYHFKAGLHVRRKHKHKCKHKGDKHKHKVTYVGAILINISSWVSNITDDEGFR